MTPEPNTIPDEIMKAAEDALDNVLSHDVEAYNGSFEDVRAAAIREIATAIHDGVMAERERWEDKVDGLQSDLDSAVEVAFRRGATEWTRLYYPLRYERLTASITPTEKAFAPPKEEGE